MSEQFSSTPCPAAPGRLEMAPGLDGIDAGAAPPISAAAPNGRGPAYGYGSNVIGDGEVHLLDYVKVLYKRRWTAITAFLVVFVSVAVYTFTATPIYEAKVQILIEKENSNVVTFKEAFDQNQITDDYYQTQYKILQSRALARRTLEGLQLWQHPVLNPRADARLSVRKILAAPAALVSKWLKAAKPAEALDATETGLQSGTIDRFVGALTVAPIRNSRLVDVKFES